MERALKEERLGLAVIARAFVQESGDAGRLLTRIEAQTRNALADPKMPMGVRQALRDGADIVRNAIAREIGKPQQLLNPSVGHVSPAAVEKVASVENNAEQLGLISNGSSLGDVQAAHTEQKQTLSAAHEALVIAIRQGAATDAEIFRRYSALQGVPHQSESSVRDRRKELTSAGRVCASGSKYRGDPMWTLVEARLANF